MPRRGIAKDRACRARRTGLRNTATEESIALRGIARVKAPVDCAPTGCACSRSAWRCRGGWRRTPASLQHVALPAGRRTTGAVAEVLRKVRCAVFLHSTCGAAVAESDRAPDHIKLIRPLIQLQLVIGRHGRIGEIHGAPFDIENSIGRGARYRGENTAGATRESRAPADLASVRWSSQYGRIR